MVAEMVAAVAHRGPDGEGCVVLRGEGDVAPVALGHRRLSILDLSDNASQPMTTRCAACQSENLDDLALVFNGEIFNYRELRQGLQATGHVMHSTGDSEVLLHLYAEYGLAALSRLNGMFAFAIRDGRKSGRPEGVQRGDLFIARDQLGVKPLYHAVVPSGFLFASELKSLLRSTETSRDIDLIGVHQHLAYLWTPAPRTILRGVQKLAPGSALLVRNGRITRQWQYYDIPMGQPPLVGTEEEIASELWERLRVAVERQMVADVPVGAFLSGGLDSSAVVAMMKRAEPVSKLRCYTIGFADDRQIDGSPADLPYARRVATHLGVQLNEINVDPGMIGRLDDMIYHLDEPNADPAPINALLIAEQARRDGLKVLLSGAGGDDIFSGYRRHRAVQAERHWIWLPHIMRRVVAGTARRQAVGGLRAPWARRVVKLLEHADLSSDERSVAYFWWGGEALRRALYAPGFADAVAGEETASPLLASLGRIPAERDPLNRMLYLEGKHFLADHNLNYTDKMGMAAGVEVRVPLLDIELVDFASRIPSAMKQRGAVGKSIFKRAMERDLPHDVIYRPKTGFGAPLRHWLRNELADIVMETLSPESLRRRGLFEPAAVRELVTSDRAGKVDGAYIVFALMCFELWCRRFIDS
jgi:asparagine synthase (glutamine-hydrolysing)